MPIHTKNCFLGLGSNLKNPTKQLKVAIKHINNLPRTKIIKLAPWYQSKAWGVTDQHDFINTVIEIRTLLTPMALLKAIKTIEYRLMHRQFNQRWHARVIDIDILLVGRQLINRKELTIPHPWIAQRPFVWLPLLKLKANLPLSLRKKLPIGHKNHKIESCWEIPQPKIHRNLVR